MDRQTQLAQMLDKADTMAASLGLSVSMGTDESARCIWVRHTDTGKPVRCVPLPRYLDPAPGCLMLMHWLEGVAYGRGRV